MVAFFPTMPASTRRATARNSQPSSTPHPSPPSSHTVELHRMVLYNPGEEQNTYHCPFKHLNGCLDGVNGRGYARASIVSHLQGKHFSAVNKSSSRASIAGDLQVYQSVEMVLLHLCMWLRSSCMKLHA